MKTPVKTLDNKTVGEIELADTVFGVKPRKDILFRAVSWQLAKRRSGNHKAKGVSEVSGTTKKPWGQKGSGRARAGSLRSAQFRKGGVIFGPVVRSHEHALPKQVRSSALRMALSDKVAEGKLLVLDAAKTETHKTKAFAAQLSKLGIASALIIDSAVDESLARAARNLPKIDVLPVMGANVYDIMRRDTLVLTKDAVAKLEERLK